MAPKTAERVGVLIVRVWEEAPGRGMRMRITYRPDVAASAETVAAAGSATEVCAHVQTWLNLFQQP